MKYVVVATDLDYGDIKIPEGAILPVESISDKSYEVVYGPYEGRSFLKVDSAPFPPYQELLLRREEVRKLTRECEEIRDRCSDMFAEARAAEKRADELIQEVDRLREQLEQRKPALPRKVAEAIAKSRYDGVKDTEILMDVSVWNWNAAIAPAKIIRDFAIQGDNIFRLADALRYGYTIKEQTISDEIVAIIDDCGDDRRRLADRLTDLFETRLEQERVKSG